MTALADDDRELLLLYVRQCYWRLFGHLNSDGDSIDLTYRQVMFLTTLREMGPTNPRRVSHVLRVTEANVKSLTDRVIQKGFAARQLDPQDGRRVILTITPKGEETLDRAISRRESQIDELLSKFTPQEKRTLIRGLQKIALRQGPRSRTAIDATTVSAGGERASRRRPSGKPEGKNARDFSRKP